MSLSEYTATAYRFFASRRRLLYWVTSVLILLSIIAFTGIRLEENIEAMLPDRGSRVAGDFALLQRAPFARKLVISLETDGEGGSAVLVAAVDRLAAALDPALFANVVTGPESQMQGRLLNWLQDAFPSILDAKDLEAMASDYDKGGVRQRLQENYEQLFAPEGWALKGLIRRDPLSIYQFGLKKLRYINMIPQMRLVDNHFVSAEGKSALLLAETPIPMTDSAGAETLLASFAEAVDKTLPDNISATLVAGHRYTLANAQAIQEDLWRILTGSMLALLALFFCFLRSPRAGFVFLLPIAVVCISAVAVSWFFSPVSAVTLGFGAVLLGITVDFGLHVYFALRRGGAAPEAIVGELARPILFGGLTTMAGFAVLLFSDLPGQRQLAVFSIAGIGAALLLSLLVLPHLIPAVGPEQGASSSRWLSRIRHRRRLVLGIWLLLLAGCGWQSMGLEFNGDLRRMSLVPPELAAAEQNLRQNWGDFRDQAMIWARGENLEQALVANEQLFALLQKEQPDQPMISIASLLPSTEVQQANRERWLSFWQGAQGQRILADLRRESAALGFSEVAFSAFFKSLNAPAQPVTLQGLRQAGLGNLVDSLVLGEGTSAEVLTLVPDRPELADLVESQLQGTVQLVSQGRFRREISAAISHDFFRFILSASVVVVLLLLLLFRRVGKVLAALVPVGTGLIVMFGCMGTLGLEFNLFNIIACILVIGLGVDYGIFMVCKSAEGHSGATDKAVLVSGLTTLAGFGALVLAHHPALHSIGVTVLLGIGAAIPAALLVVPALYRGEDT
ncbi:MAG: hypothetical protein BA869_12675 [Desulfuromonadales bacterium C00003107]|nr:MAG: hypothetical protein BA869_12675 [Desulfuromonadales bacterium C00003107]